MLDMESKLCLLREKIGLQGIRWLSALLVVVSLWALWGNWVVLVGDARDTVTQTFQYADSVTDMAENLADELESYVGVKISLSALKKAVRAMQDGGLSLSEARLLMGIGGKISSALKDNPSLSYWFGEDTLGVLRTVGRLNLLYQLCFFATVGAALWAAIQRARKRTDVFSSRVYPIMYSVWLAACVLLTLYLWKADDFQFSLRPTLWALLAPACAWFSCILWNAFDTQIAGANTTDFGKLDLSSFRGGITALEQKGKGLFSKGTQAFQQLAGNPWTCPVCGTEMTKEKNFCTQCGAKHPEPQRCAYCGAVQEPGVTFCANCGKPFFPQQKCGQCGAVVKPDEKFCASCGAPQETAPASSPE